MRKVASLILFLLCFLFGGLAAQKNFNFNFEKAKPGTNQPEDWGTGVGGSSSSSYSMTLDSASAVEGRRCLHVEPGNSKEEYGSFVLSFPADFEGKSIELKGFMKTKDVSDKGFAGLWMRIDGDGGTLAFDNMQSQFIHGTTDWTAYNIELEYPEDARMVVLGGLLVGGGQAWFDNYQVLVDGKPLQDVKPRVVVKLPAELDSAFNKGSGITIGKLDKHRIEGLALLGKVWGFLKYHHPAIAAGKLNWDFELFRFLPSYLAVKNDKQRDKLLTDWIKSLGPLPDCNNCIQKIESDVLLGADLKWMYAPDLSKSLREQLQYVYERRNQKKNYYIDHAPSIGNPVFKHEDPYTQFKFPDEGFRLLSLYRYWNIIQYFFPYRDVIGEDWNLVLNEFMPKIVEAPTALDYKLNVRRLIGRVHDTHANLWMQDPEMSKFFGELRPAVQTKFIENQLVVVDYYHPELGPKSGLLIGDVITAVEGVPVPEIEEKTADLYPSSNIPTRRRDMAKSILRTNNPNINLKVLRDGKPMEISVPCMDAKSANLDLSKDWAYKQPDSCYRLLNNDIGYLYLGNVKTDLLPTIFEKFKNTKGLVIDIRNYPSEFMVFSLAEYLKPRSSEFVYFSAGSTQHPGVFTQTPMIANGSDNPNPYKGKVVILINEMSQSQAEYTTMALRTVPNSVVVGSTTAGADGNVSSFSLPGGLRTMISGIGVFYPDGKPTQRVGIVPDFTVLPTIAGIKAGRDELLEYAMRLILGP